MLFHTFIYSPLHEIYMYYTYIHTPTCSGRTLPNTTVKPLPTKAPPPAWPVLAIAVAMLMAIQIIIVVIIVMNKRK